MAALTLAELETWLALAIAGKYHQEIHATLRQSPMQRFATGLTAPPAPLSDPKAFLVDFLPLVRRRIQRRGFVVDHIAYFSDALRPWIAARETAPPFLIRRDPRDLSRIWVLEPGTHFYVEVPYLAVEHPAITVWEHRQALARLKAQGAPPLMRPPFFAWSPRCEASPITPRNAPKRPADYRHDGQAYLPCPPR
jgi:putative transposase